MASRKSIAFALDIDGVLVRGKKALPGARETLGLLQSNKIPFVFLTNGGGLTEEAHVERLGRRLDLTFDKDQFIQSHTPFYDLVPLYRKKTILAVGGHGQQIRELAHAYGFGNVVISSDLMHEHEHIHPFPEMTRDHHNTHGRRPRRRSTITREGNFISESPTPGISTADAKALHIAAILIWSSPRDWCLDLQVITDLLLSHRGHLGTVSPLNGSPDLPNHGYQQDGQPLLYFCNPDLEWATPHHLPRFAQGAFRAALAGVWSELTKQKAVLQAQVWGKPTGTTFGFAERALAEWHRKTNGGEQAPAIKTVYMIGDNPESDICGANAHRSECGTPWRSILVESGVHVAGTRPAHQPHHVARDVEEAVLWALEQEGVVLWGMQDGKETMAHN